MANDIMLFDFDKAKELRGTIKEKTKAIGKVINSTRCIVEESVDSNWYGASAARFKKLTDNSFTKINNDLTIYIRNIDQQIKYANDEKARQEEKDAGSVQEPTYTASQKSSGVVGGYAGFTIAELIAILNDPNISHQKMLRIEREIEDLRKREIEGMNKPEIDDVKMNSFGAMLSNIENDKSLGLSDTKKKTIMGIGNIMLQEGYEPAFVAGMLANIIHEGTAGRFENSNYKTNPSAKPDYLVNMDKEFDYTNKYSDKNLQDISLSELGEMLDKLPDDGDGKKADGTRIGFGLGSVQWTFSRTKELFEFYDKVTGDSDTITFDQMIEAEGLMICHELKNTRKKAYAEWGNDIDKADPAQAAYDAGVSICKYYEAPKVDSSAARGQIARNVYNVMIVQQ